MTATITNKRVAICFGWLTLILLAAHYSAGLSVALALEQQEATGNERTGNLVVEEPAKVIRCSRQSVQLARQMLAHELEQMNSVGLPIWLQDLDKTELIESQKQSLGNIIMSSSTNSNNRPLLSDLDGRLLMELEASCFRFPSADQLSALLSGRSTSSNASPKQPAIGKPDSNGSFLRLSRRRPEACYLDTKSNEFVYEFALSVGPIEHQLDVTYNLPREVRLTQPNEWRYAQVSILVPRLGYDVVLRQVAGKAEVAGGCHLSLADMTYQPSAGQLGHQRGPLIQSCGLAAGNQTQWQLDRLFSDYTRPAISERIRQAIKFQLSAKTLPLEVE